MTTEVNPFAAGAPDAEDAPAHEFVFGLDRILDGVAILVQGRASADGDPSA